MPRNIVLKDGVLSAEVTSYEQVEMAQLESEVSSRQEACDSLQAQVDAFSAQLAEAQAALEDSKSELGLAQGLVGEPTVSTDEVPVDVHVADSNPEFQV